MIKKLLSLFLILCLITPIYASDVLPGEDYKTDAANLNEQLRQLDVSNQIKSDGKLDLQSKKITNLATPTATTDATTKAYVDAAVAAVPELQVKVGTFTRDIATASGTQTITGVGFTPKAVIFLACITSTIGNISWGIDDGTSHNSIQSYDNITDDQWIASTGNSIYVVTGAGVGYTGEISSFNSDGFAINWTKIGAATGTLTVYYLAIG